MAWLSPFLRQLGAGVRMLVVLTLLVGVGYPLVVLGIGQLIARDQAGGSLVGRTGSSASGSAAVGSSLVGQSFPGAKWFHGRPSASDYTGDTSGGSNLGPFDKRLTDAVAKRRAALSGVAGSAAVVPPDALTASASGLDPDISPAYAAAQVAGVAAARGLQPAAVRALVATHTKGRTAGFLGEPRVDVLELNIALQRLKA